MKISYVITVHNKSPYLLHVIRSLAAEQDASSVCAEYIFVDDGSSDNSVEVIHKNEHLLPGKVIILEQDNQGAAAATNAGVGRARHEWIRLLDGDDVVCRNSTAAMYAVAQKEGVKFVIGSFGYFSQDADLLTQIETVDEERYVVMSQDDALRRFIRSFPHNSSCMLIEKLFFNAVGGADTRLISPDYTIALRATARCDRLVRMRSNVAQMVASAPGRLSSQVGRSRYESVLAIYLLAHELMPNRRDVAIAVYKRACSRSYRYARILGHRPLWHFLRYVRSRLVLPKDLKAETYLCLAAYTPNAKPDRPAEWVPGYQKDNP